jgi:hypothetical protein
MPGHEWGESIIDGIHEARAFLLIFSGNANESPQVRREVERAVGHGLPLIPFRIEDVTPAKSLEYFISNQHWLDALTPPIDRHLVHLTEVVTRLLGEPSSAAPSIAAGATVPARSTAGKSLRSWQAVGGILLFLAAGAAVFAFQYLPRGVPEVSASNKQAPNLVAAPTVASAAQDRSWLYGRWCVDGDRRMVQTISGDERRLITDFSGQRQVEEVRRSAIDSVATDVATYSRRGNGVVVSEPGYSYRLEECRP